MVIFEICDLYNYCHHQQAATLEQGTCCWKLPHFAPRNTSGLFLFNQRLLQNVSAENKQIIALEIYIHSFLFFKVLWPHFPIFPSFRLLISHLICCNKNIIRFSCSICPAVLLGHFKVACKILIFQARILPYSIALPQTSEHQFNCSFVWACQFLHFRTPTSVWAFCQVVGKLRDYHVAQHHLFSLSNRNYWLNELVH